MTAAELLPITATIVAQPANIKPAVRKAIRALGVKSPFWVNACADEAEHMGATLTAQSLADLLVNYVGVNAEMAAMR